MTRLPCLGLTAEHFEIGKCVKNYSLSYSMLSVPHAIEKNRDHIFEKAENLLEESVRLDEFFIDLQFAILSFLGGRR